MYIFGGRDGNTFKNDVFEYHFVTNTWKEVETTGSRPLPRYGHRAVVYGGKMIIFGGHGANVYLNDLLELNLDTFEWRRIHGGGQAPTPRWQPSMVVWRGELVIFGGCDSNAFLNDLYAFNIEHRFWRNLPIDDYSIPPTPRMHHGAVVVGESMFIFGGQTVDAIKNDLFEYSFELSCWNFVGVFEDNFRRNFACVEFNGKMLIMGGYSGGPHNDIIQYNTESGSWAKLVTKEGQSPSKRSGHTANIYGNKMVVFGGLGSDGSQNDLYELSMGLFTEDEDVRFNDAEVLSQTPPSPEFGMFMASSPTEMSYLHQISASSAPRSDILSSPYLKEENPLVAMYREELIKLRAEMEVMRQENFDLKREVASLKAERAEGSPYILI